MIQPRLFFSFPAKNRKAFVSGKNAYQPQEGEYLLNHNRSGLLLALKSLGLPMGSHVGVMVYNCHTVMNAVDQAGFKVRFIDVDENLRMDLEDLRRKKGELSALIVSHLFGIANDIDDIKKVCTDIPIVEDCAHAYGMRQSGSKGDFAVYSIGPGKFPSVGDGGILKVNNKVYKAALDRRYAEVSDYSRVQEWRLFGKLLATHWLYKPRVYSMVTLPFLKRNNKKIAVAKEPVRVQRMAHGISALYAMALPSVDQWLARHRAVSMDLTKLFGGKKDVRVVNDSIEESNCFMFPLYCEQPSAIKADLRQNGIEAETHFRHCLIWAKEFGYEDGNCPKTEDLLRHLLMVPTYKKLR